MIQIQDILNAYKTVQPIVHKTPLMQSHALDEKTGNAVFFKCENFQKVGAFKIRGAYNKIASLSAEQKAKGVVAFSSGNHAQGVALASRLLGTTSKIVMPDNSPKSKMEATRAYGAEVIVYDFLKEDREAIGKRISELEGRTLVPPFNDEYIMAGQGTVSVELVEQISDLDYAFIPCGGGGLLSGNAVALKHFYPHIKVVGVETDTANDAYQSFNKGEIVKIAPPPTIADGMRTLALGDKTFPVIRRYVDAMLTVSDHAVIEAMYWIYSRLKIVVEPTAAVPFAAVMQNTLQLRGKKIAVILSGGNIDLDDFFELLKRQAA